MKRILSALTALCMAGALCACDQAKKETDSEWDLNGMPQFTTQDIEIPSMTIPEISVTSPDVDLPDTSVPKLETADPSVATAAAPNGTIKDETGEFTYSGELRQIGDDEHGYIQIPADFVNYQDVDVSGLVQASDRSGTNIVTLTHYSSVDYQTLANSMRAQMESNENATGITGAKAAPNGYEALQVYCYYQKDQIFLVAWSIKDPADDKSSYFLTIEFDHDHQYLLACSSTLRSVEDYHKENG